MTHAIASFDVGAQRAPVDAVIAVSPTWWSDGYLKLAQTLAPWNVGNWIAVVMAVAPGWLLFVWADRIEARRESADRG